MGQRRGYVRLVGLGGHDAAVASPGPCRGGDRRHARRQGQTYRPRRDDPGQAGPDPRHEPVATASWRWCRKAPRSTRSCFRIGAGSGTTSRCSGLDSGWERQRPSGAAPGSPQRCRNKRAPAALARTVFSSATRPRDLRRSGTTSPRSKRGLPETLDQDAALGGAPALKTDDEQLNLDVLKP
jgi:hypothetical protein